MKQFKGIFPALITPFDGKGNINEKALEIIIEKNIRDGVDGFYLSGSTGESYMMSNDQRKSLIKLATGIVNKRVPVIANIGSFSLDQALDMADCAGEQGIDAISSVPPFYFPFSKQEIKNYYISLQGETGLPVIIYNIPGMSGINFTTEELSELLACSGIAGIKQTTYNLFQTEQLVRRNPEKSIFNGHDEIFLSALAVGVEAAIGSTVSIMAHKFIAVQKAFGENKMKEAQKAQGKINDMVESLLKVGIFKGIKAVFSLQGIECGVCKKPFEELTPEELRFLEKALDKLNS